MDNIRPIKFSQLKPGDLVDIVAPSSKCHNSVIDKFKKLLSDWELEYRVPKNLFGESLLYANSEEMRFTHLKNALLNSDSKAVWCLLGGFGATKIIPLLNQLPSPDHCKMFIGFSDITALHIFIQQRWGWPTVHGPSGYQAVFQKVSHDSLTLLKQFMFQKERSFIYEKVKPLNDLAKNDNVIEASLIGGNLHLIQASIGTDWQLIAKNKVIFIEEFNERAYRVDRVLTQLSQAGIFNQVRAILFGDMIDKVEPDGRCLLAKVISDFAYQCPFPVLQLHDVGHGFVNKPLLLGGTAKLTMGTSFSLSFRL